MKSRIPAPAIASKSFAGRVGGEIYSVIIVRSPLRITLGGGGTDLPSYYRAHEGFLIAAAIDRYVYITVHKMFHSGFIVKYSQLENVRRREDIRHPIVREALALTGVDDKVEITSLADIPAGTGLGSSGSFTTALLQALHAHQRSIVSTRELAEQACYIEIDRLGEPIGKQDQFIAAYGGVTCFRFHKDDKVDVWPAAIGAETLTNLEEGLTMFFTGMSRSASAILKGQDDKSKAMDSAMVDNLHFVKDLGRRSLSALESGDLHKFGKLMDEHWQHKKKRSDAISTSEIDKWYDIALRNGALGGKLVGAGGGGFLMLYAEDKKRLRHAMREAGLEEVRVRFDFEGTKTLVQ
jgi:D-glycero-alpha-D-manno-heptose-7-phosphate kinase